MSPTATRHLFDLEARDVSLVGRGLRQRFHPDDWRRAGSGQREEMARAAHAYIRASFGLDERPLHLTWRWPDFMLGNFDPRTRDVTVHARLLKLDDPSALLGALAHENRHAVQEERIAGRQPVPYGDQVGGGEVEAWKEATKIYTRGEYVDYHYNALEVDAREAASSLVDQGFWAEHRRLLEERAVEVGR